MTREETLKMGIQRYLLANCLSIAYSVFFVSYATIAQNTEKSDRTIPKKHSSRECVPLSGVLTMPENVLEHKINQKK